MKQLDVIRHAKEYLEKLNQGIDPISGNYVPDDSLVRQTPMHQCFYYCANNLSLILQGDGEDIRVFFSLTEEQKKQLSPAKEAISITTFLERVNAWVDKSEMIQLAPLTVNNWLQQQGYLEPTAANGNKKQPTNEGQVLGITSKTINSSKGTYQILLFNTQAQQFLIDHIDDISAFRHQTAASGKKKIPLKDPKLLWVNQVWMQQLSKGVDPTTGNVLPDGHILCQKRLQKCFDFVAQVFEQVLKNGYFSAKKPFSLSKEVWSEIAIDEEGVVSGLVSNINACIKDPTAVRKLSIYQLTSWLLQQGMMFETLSEKGRQTRRFTPQGEQMGFCSQKEPGLDGKEITRMHGNESAQRYILDHLGEIIDFCANT